MKIAGLLAALLILSGCASPTYKYNNVTYPTRDAAVLAARANVKERVNGVPESQTRIPGSTLIVVPTRDVIRQYGVRTTGNAKEDQVEYIVDVLEIGFLGRADVVKAGKLFDKVDIVRASNVENYPLNGYDYKIWLLGSGIGQWQWYLSMKDKNTKEPLTPDMGLSGSQQSASFNEAIVKAAKLLGTSPTPASTPASAPKPIQSNNSPVKSSGSAFFVNDHGIAISNAHVVNDCSSVQAVLRNGEVAQASVLATDRENDLAVVKVSYLNKSFAHFRVGQPVRQGEPVVVYGYPLAGALASKGSLSAGVVSALAGLLDDTRKLQISAPVQPGNSGGPVLDQNGNLIGVVASKLNALKAAKITGDIPQNVNFAIKAGVAMNFLEANSVDFDTKTSRKSATTEDLGDIAKAFTFKLECR